MCHLHRKCGGCAYGGNKRDTAHGGFLHEFEAGPTADQHHMVMQGKLVIDQSPPQNFIQRIVPSDIFPQTEQSAFLIKQA